MLAIVLVAFFIVHNNEKRALFIVFVWAMVLTVYTFGHNWLGHRGAGDPLVSHVDKFTVKGKDLYFGRHKVTVEKEINPMLFLRCKEEILLRVYGEDYFLNIDDNI